MYRRALRGDDQHFLRNLSHTGRAVGKGPLGADGGNRRSTVSLDVSIGRSTVDGGIPPIVTETCYGGRQT